MKHIIELKNKFVKLEVSEIDCAALAYLVYAQKSEKLALPMEIVDFKKNLVFKELHNFCVTNFGFDHGVVKYSNLLGLMHDLNELHNNFKDVFIIWKILDPTLLDVFDVAV
uniref:Uncharacterized protein n=1 Tax=Acrobeloides nanus TaxID=290746 RepID=A0A914E4G2_9BILA